MLRPSLLPGLVDACAHNRRRERKDIRLFEAGSRFTSDGEGRAVAFVWSGAADAPHWSAPSRNVDFFDVKGVVEGICDAVGIAPEFAPAQVGFLVPGQAAELRVPGTTTALGVVGKLVPAIVEARGFPAAEERLRCRDRSSRADDRERRVRSTCRRAAALSVDRARHLDARRRYLACCHCSWHYPFGGAVDAGGNCRVRSLPGQRRPRWSRQPVAAAHVPRAGSDDDRRRSADRDGENRRRAAHGARRGAEIDVGSRLRALRLTQDRRVCGRRSCQSPEPRA